MEKNIEDLRMEKELSRKDVAGLMLERACVECSCEHRVAIDMSRAGKYDACLHCKQYRNVYKIVR